MRVAWVIYGALDQRTGGYVYDRMIVERLRSEGDAVEIVSIVPASDPVDLARRLTATASDAVVGDALAARELGFALAGFAGVVNRLLLVHHLTSWERDSGNPSELQAAERRAIESSDRLVTTSAWTAARMGKEYGRGADVVVPGADRLPCLPRLPPDEAHTVLVFVGSIVPRKRLALLLDAMDRLAEPRLELRIVGDAARDKEHAASIAARVTRSPYLRAHVSSLGAVDDRALASELARADALVLPSSLEGYGMVLTEALRAGVPVIGASAGAIPEVVGTCAGAALFGDENGLVDLLERFASRAELRERMRRAAEERAPTLPTWDQAALAFRDVLTRTAGTRGAEGPSFARGR